MKGLKRVSLTILLAAALMITGCGAVEEKKEDALPSEGQEESGQDIGNISPEMKNSRESQEEDETSSFLFVMSTSYSMESEAFNGDYVDFDGGYIKSGTMKTGDRAMLVKSDGSSYEVTIERMALYREDDKGNPTLVDEAREGPLVFVWLEENPSEELQEQATWKLVDRLQYGDMLFGMKEWEQGILVEFPFEESEEYSLAFGPSETGKGQGEFRLYDRDGAVLQRIPYGAFELPEYHIFRRNGERNLVFFSPAGYNSAECYCYTWDGERFTESEIDIKRGMTGYLSDLFITEETETSLIRKIYRKSRDSRESEEIRRYELQKDTGELVIWDCLDRKTIYQAAVPMKEDGIPVNEEYYQVMFTEGLYPWAWEDGEEDTSFFVETSLSSAKELYTEYSSREAFLDDYRFAGSEPIYRYYDRMGNLRLELYEDKSAALFGGVMYQYFYDSNKRKCAEMSGFVIDIVDEGKWEDDTYSVMSLLDGYDCEKRTDYTADKKPTYFLAEGDDKTAEKGEENNVMLMEIDYIYRDDGTLYDRHYRHNSQFLSTTRSSEDSLYDEKGRLVYKQAYITHGTLEDYYIYLDSGDMPAYHLGFDYGMGPVPSTTMERYR